MSAALYGADQARKPDIYLREYHRLFAPLRSLPIRLLELGVRYGPSMKMWEKYFPRATVVGLDGEAKPASFPTDQRFHFVWRAQDDPALLDQAIALAGGPFDIVIDDCSHLGCHTARAWDDWLRKQLLDHSQALTAAGAYTEYPIERLTVMTNIAILHKAK